MTCGDEGYALKYGYKQCQATQDSYHQFNDEVKISHYSLLWTKNYKAIKLIVL